MVHIIDCTMSSNSCFVVILIYFCLNIMMGTLCQAFDDDDNDNTRCSNNYVFYQNDGSSWIPLTFSPCTLTPTRSAKESVMNLPNDECTNLDDVCGKFERVLLRIDDDANPAFQKINRPMLQIFNNQSYRLVYFEDEESCKEIIYAEKETVGKLLSPSITLLICQNTTHDVEIDQDKSQTKSPANRITTMTTPINEARKNGVGNNSTSEVDNVTQSSAVLMYVSYALTGVAILSAILTLSVCCISHHKRRKRTFDNGHYDAEYNLTVEQDTPPPQQTEVNDHTRPDQTSKAKVKLEFNNAIYNTSGLITKVIIQPNTNQDPNSNLEYSDAGQGSRNVPVHHQNGECQKSTAGQPHLSKSIKDIDKIGTSTFPSGEYQDFAVELKSKVRKVLSNPTYVHEDDVIRSPICAKPGRQLKTKAISSDNIQFVNVGLSVPKESSKGSHKMICTKEGPGQSESEPKTSKHEIRTQNSPENLRMIDGLHNGDKYPAIQPRDMSYMYVQLPKEWSKDIPIEEPTVPYASTDVTTTIFKHVSAKTKNRHNGRRLMDDDGVYETYDRRT